MASITKRGERWLARVRIKQGNTDTDKARSFATKREAEAWARDLEQRLTTSGGMHGLGERGIKASFFICRQAPVARLAGGRQVKFLEGVVQRHPFPFFAGVVEEVAQHHELEPDRVALVAVLEHRVAQLAEIGRREA